MNKFLFAFTALSLSAGYAQAERLYLKKTYTLDNMTGHYKIVCRFYNQKVHVEEWIHGSYAHEWRMTSQPGSYLSSLVSSASKQSLTSKPYNMCDAGSEVISTYKASGSSVTLRKYTDCGAKWYYRKGSAATKLRNIADESCTTILD